MRCQARAQAELAARMGIDRGYISGLEKGERNPTVVTLWHLGQALDVQAGEFLKPKRAKRHDS